MKGKKLTALLLGTCMTATLFAGCGNETNEAGNNAAAGSTTPGTENTAVDAGAGVGALRDTEYSEDEIINFTMFTAMPDAEINDGNDIQEIIAKKTGVRVKETWLTGQTDAEAIGTIIAGGEYPDFINGGESMKPLYDAGALVAWDDYIPISKKCIRTRSGNPSVRMTAIFTGQTYSRINTGKTRPPLTTMKPSGFR